MKLKDSKTRVQKIKKVHSRKKKKQDKDKLRVSLKERIIKRNTTEGSKCTKKKRLHGGMISYDTVPKGSLMVYYCSPNNNKFAKLILDSNLQVSNWHVGIHKILKIIISDLKNFKNNLDDFIKIGKDHLCSIIFISCNKLIPLEILKSVFNFFGKLNKDTTSKLEKQIKEVVADIITIIENLIKSDKGLINIKEDIEDPIIEIIDDLLKIVSQQDVSEIKEKSSEAQDLFKILIKIVFTLFVSPYGIQITEPIIQGENVKKIIDKIIRVNEGNIFGKTLKQLTANGIQEKIDEIIVKLDNFRKENLDSNAKVGLSFTNGIPLLDISNLFRGNKGIEKKESGFSIREQFEKSFIAKLLCYSQFFTKTVNRQLNLRDILITNRNIFKDNLEKFISMNIDNYENLNTFLSAILTVFPHFAHKLNEILKEWGIITQGTYKNRVDESYLSFSLIGRRKCASSFDQMYKLSTDECECDDNWDGEKCEIRKFPKGFIKYTDESTNIQISSLKLKIINGDYEDRNEMIVPTSNFYYKDQIIINDKNELTCEGYFCTSNEGEEEYFYVESKNLCKKYPEWNQSKSTQLKELYFKEQSQDVIDNFVEQLMYHINFKLFIFNREKFSSDKREYIDDHVVITLFKKILSGVVLEVKIKWRVQDWHIWSYDYRNDSIFIQPRRRDNFYEAIIERGNYEIFICSDEKKSSAETVLLAPVQLTASKKENLVFQIPVKTFLDPTMVFSVNQYLEMEIVDK